MEVTLIQRSMPTETFLDRTIERLGITEDDVEVYKRDAATPEAMTVYIARVSSSREDKFEDYAGLVRYLIDNNHWSPFEHSYMTFEIVTSRAIGRQLLRHRSFTFQEFSQRYAEVTEFEPIEIREQAEKNRQSSTDVVGHIYGPDNYQVPGEALEDYGFPIRHAAELLGKIERTYQLLLDAGVAKECARMILPVAAQTTIYMTGNLRSWIHFLGLRDDEHSQKEAQLIAREIKDVFMKENPVITSALDWN